MNVTDIMNTRLNKKEVYNLDDLNCISKRCDWFINGNQVIKKNICLLRQRTRDNYGQWKDRYDVEVLSKN
jgi:hypothetical protein